MNRVTRAWHRFNQQFPSALTRFKRNLWWYHLRPKLWFLWQELLRPFFRSSLSKSPTNMSFEQHLQQWRFFGDESQYTCDVDMSGLGGTSSAFLKSTGAHAAVARLEQAIKADAYRGKHLRFSSEVKAEHVEQRAGLRIRIMTPPSFWRDVRSRQGRERRLRYELTLPVPVPEDARAIVFGLLLMSAGQIWLANARLEVIAQDGLLSV
ncbi:MAG TPA: hypothetical protein VF043_01180 [Ktedonobacteraceae bacterium]